MSIKTISLYSVFPYRNPLIFNLVNKKNLIIPLIEMTSATFPHSYIDTMSEKQASRGACSEQQKPFFR